ncbi:putative 4-hydroxy-4-methyl-2-oxoglutarate aldolase [wastewater metagenome]|uniref:Oxaloacetate decarboxylase n=2 Tax=unclassified sequences TaxID=12908 RepID=A0A5B8RAH8_9ZZZZ|nr:MULTISPECIES: ribonuclease E activity regulator RraA [Arhodomonas]MCS4503156.1 ribonuclease E activity regulator RraA [Arhodomonas aquaeolei]QEA04524.1 putative 4-hydroxy-4-methyl-2-oxoglutarate aldolase [uncultured organism]
MTTPTTDLCDAHEGRLRILTPIFSDYGGRRSFSGPVLTVKVFEDNSFVRDALSEPGEGRVLVVDGGGSLRCALLGDNLAAMARDNGWSGIVVYGCIRDSGEIGGLDIGVKALNVHPRRSEKRGEGERGIPVSFAGVTIRPEDWLYADEDGIVVADERLD